MNLKQIFGALFVAAFMLSLAAIPASADSVGYKIGVQSGTTSDTYAAESLPNVVVHGFDTIDLALAALKQGDVQFVMGDLPTLKYYEAEADPGGSRGKAIMTAHGDLQPAAQGGAVDGGDDGLGRPFEAVNEIAGGRRPRGARLVEFPYIGPGDKGPPRADQNQGGNLRIALPRRDGIHDALGHAKTQRIDRRIDNGNNADRAALGILNEIVHGQGAPGHTTKNTKRLVRVHSPRW